jgi:hypothetical protein
VDGVDEQYPIAFYNQVVYYSSTFVVGSRGDQYEPFVGELCEVMFAPGQYVDVSQPGNRAKFSSGRFPIALDFDLILGTGVRPLLYLDHPYDSFQQNSGTGGNLTLIGALTQGTPPQ